MNMARVVDDITSILNQLDSEDAFSREDESDDGEFYQADRFVHHLDSLARTTVTQVMETLIVEENPVVLDLMAGWDSHLPDGMNPKKVVGLGLNKNELESNRRLSESVIHDLNKNPNLPFPDEMFDAVINTVSIDYLTKPFDVFREVGRILKPGGLFLVLFSNRWFPPKVVRIWKDATEQERIDLVREYFAQTGAFEACRSFISLGKPRPRDDKYAELGVPSDPIFAVYADKKGDTPSRKARPPLSVQESAPFDLEGLERRKREIKNSFCCPYCGERLKKWAVPNDPFFEWDSDYLYICFNDSCPYLVRGWMAMFRQGNRGFSYRLIYNPNTDSTIAMPVYNLTALRQGIVGED